MLSKLLSSIGILLIFILTGCGSSSSTSIIVGKTPTQTALLSPMASPSPIATNPSGVVTASGWKTYQDTKNGFSITYPANWYANSGSDYFDVYNYDFQSYNSPGWSPGYTKIEILIASNPTNLSARGFFQQQMSDPTLPTGGTNTLTDTVLAGKNSLQVYSTDNRGIHDLVYYIPIANKMMMLGQLNVTSSTLTSVFATMVNSLAFF
jgi:hypothetical protein